MRCPTKSQFLAFGAITHYYACAESGIKIALAGILGISVTEFLILSEPYSSLDLRNVAKSIADQYEMTPEMERFRQIVGDFGTFGPLRNLIGHSRWTKGSRRASIKPFRIDIRSGKAKLHGAEEGEQDWTTKELVAEANKLGQINIRIIHFIKDTGIAATMAAKEVEISALIESSEGISKSPS